MAKVNKGGRKRVLPDKLCICGKTYRPPSAKTKFCGIECARANRPLKGVTLKCFCGAEFYISKSQVRKNNFCSKECVKKQPTTKMTKVCLFCKSEYQVYRSQVKHRGSLYCDRICRGKHKSLLQVGENNPSWRGGVSTENHRLRQSKAFKEWRKAVFERDDYTCQFCGVRGGYLEPDHIKPFAYFKEDRFDIDNGRTLCKPCHKTTETYGHKARKLHEV